MQLPFLSRKSMRLASGLVTVALFAAFVAGCGGTQSLSHSSLVAKTNQDCRRANSAVSQLGAPTASLTALTGYAAKVLPISQQLVTNLSTLKPSSGDQSAFNQLVAALKNGNRGLKMMETASSTAQANAASQIIIAKSVPKAADTLGAATCATSPSA